MKRIFFAILVVVIPFSTVAQKKNITEAIYCMGKAGSKDSKSIMYQLEEAKKYIDLAYSSESTSNHAKMWVNRGKIYFRIAQVQKTNEITYRDYETLKTDSINITDRGDIEITASIEKKPNLIPKDSIRVIDKDAIYKALSSYLNCFEKNKSGETVVKKRVRRNYMTEEELLVNLDNCVVFLVNGAVDQCAEEKFKEALKMYDAVYPVFDLDKDNLLELLKKRGISRVFIIKNSILVAKAMKNNELAKKLILSLLNDNEISDPSLYLDMSNILLDEGDNDGALKYISEAREKFPDDENARIAEINLYIQLERTDELIKKITAIIDNDPTNDLYYEVRGKCYQSIDMIEEAISDYSSAININPENSDALNNISKCYLIQIELIIKKMNALGMNQTSKYKAYKKQVNDLYRKALPHLQNYVELNPDDEVNKKALEQIKYKLKN